MQFPNFDRFASLAETLNGRLSFFDNTFRIVDNSDETKKIAFEASGITTATTRTITVPDASGTLLLSANAGYAPVSGTLLFTNIADFTGTDVNTAQPVFEAAGDTVTLAATTTYLMYGSYHIHTTGTTSHTLSLLFGGTATLTSIGGTYHANNSATEVLGATSSIPFAAATAVAVSPATATATHHNIIIHGLVRANATGTFIPQYQWSAAPGAAGVSLANSHLVLIPMGVNTLQGLGVS